MIDSIALETTQAMNSIQLSMSYATAVTELAMDTQELALKNITDLLPAVPTIPLGQYIDTYA